MTLFSLVFKNLRGHRLRSVAIFLAVMSISAFLLTVSITAKGAEYSLNVGMQRLGADIIVVPAGGEYAVEVTSPEGCGGPQVIIPVGSSALLIGDPAVGWMPETRLQEVAAVPGVLAVSPQIFLGSIASSVSGGETYVIAFDPVSDFTLQPWLETRLKRNLQPGEVLGGSAIIPGSGNQIQIDGQPFNLVGNLEPSGTAMDRSIFMTIENAYELGTASTGFYLELGQVSSMMVKTVSGSDVHAVAIDINAIVEGVVPVESPSLFGVFNRQVNGLLWVAVAIMLVFWAVSAYLINLIIKASINERRREVAILRTMGADFSFVFISLIGEAGLLTVSGGLGGIILAAFGANLFGNFITSTLGIPFLFPGAGTWLGLVGIGATLLLITVMLAAAVPAFRMSRQEPALAVREI